MKLYLDTNSWLLSPAPGGSNTTVILQAKQGTDLAIEIIPSRPLESGALGSLIAKPKDDYAASSVSWDLAWENPATSESGYRFDLSLKTAALGDLFTGSVKSIPLMAEITITQGSEVSKTQTFAINVARQVSIGEAGTPADLPDLKANEQEAVEGTANNKWMTPLRTKQAVLQAISEIDAGVNGASAYELAVEAGFSGSVEEWLLSLVGPQGEPGQQGDPGINGLSASVLNLPTDYDNFTLTRTDGNVTSISYSKNGDEIGVAILTWDTSVTPNRVATASDGTKTVTLIYNEAGQVTGGTIS
jgi:hypothetical protein